MKRSHESLVRDYMTAQELLLFDAAVRRGDRKAAGNHWLAALVRLARDERVSARARDFARSCFTPEALQRILSESPER